MKTFYRKPLALCLSLAILFLFVGTATAGHVCPAPPGDRYRVKASTI